MSGGYRYIQKTNVSFLLAYLDAHRWYKYVWIDDYQTLKHIIEPTCEYNFWDMYVGLLRDPFCKNVSVRIIDSPRRVRICDGGGVDICVEYFGMTRKTMLPYVWECQCPHQTFVVSSHTEMVDTISQMILRSRYDIVMRQLSLHPRFLICMIDNGATIDDWIHKHTV